MTHLPAKFDGAVPPNSQWQGVRFRNQEISSQPKTDSVMVILVVPRLAGATGGGPNQHIHPGKLRWQLEKSPFPIGNIHLRHVTFRWGTRYSSGKIATHKPHIRNLHLHMESIRPRETDATEQYSEAISISFVFFFWGEGCVYIMHPSPKKINTNVCVCVTYFLPKISKHFADYCIIIASPPQKKNTPWN